MADAPRFKPQLAASPIFGAGTRPAAIRSQYDQDKIVRLASNECALGPSPQAIQAVHEKAVSLGRYPAMLDDELRASLAQVIGRGMQADNFITGNGGCDVLDIIARSFLEADDEVVICRPTFPIYEVTARRAGARPVFVDLEPPSFAYDVEAVLSAVTEKTRLIYICTPNNPTGNLLPASQLTTLIKTAPPQVAVVIDECYHHFVTTGEWAESSVKEGHNVIVLHSFSKAYGLAGLRVGYAFATPRLAEYLQRARNPFHLSSLALSAAQAALNDREHLARAITHTIDGRAYLQRQLGELGLSVWPSQANFILFKTEFPTSDVFEGLLRRGILIRPLAGFYLPDHLRVTVGLPDENRRFIAALGEVLAELTVETTRSGPL
jgi:histidinol-phosphate aminotransferase